MGKNKLYVGARIRNCSLSIVKYLYFQRIHSVKCNCKCAMYSVRCIYSSVAFIDYPPSSIALIHTLGDDTSYKYKRGKTRTPKWNKCLLILFPFWKLVWDARLTWCVFGASEFGLQNAKTITTMMVYIDITTTSLSLSYCRIIHFIISWRAENITCWQTTGIVCIRTCTEGSLRTDTVQVTTFLNPTNMWILSVRIGVYYHVFC